MTKPLEKISKIEEERKFMEIEKNEPLSYEEKDSDDSNNDDLFTAELMPIRPIRIIEKMDSYFAWSKTDRYKIWASLERRAFWLQNGYTNVRISSKQPFENRRCAVSNDSGTFQFIDFQKSGKFFC